MSIIVETPFQNFTGLDGKPLTNGRVYIGQVGTDPTVPANQIPVFWDAALAIPAAQPLQTNAGYIVRLGAPARVYVATDYSISVRNSSNMLVYYLAGVGAADLVSQGEFDSFVNNTNSAIAQLNGVVVNASDPRFAGGVRPGVDIGPCLQAAHDYAVANFSSATVTWNPMATDPVMNTGLVWDTNKVGLTCAQPINATLFSDPIFLRVIQSDNNPGSRPGLNSMHPFINMVINGPGKNFGSTGILLEDMSSLATVAGVTFYGGAIWGFAVCLHLGRGSYFTSVNNMDFGTSNGFNGGSGTHVFNQGNVDNSGERNVFNQCRWFGAGSFLIQGNGNASTFLNNCSFNYGDDRMMFISGGSVFINGLHWEAKQDTEYWAFITGNNTKLSISNMRLALAAAKPNFSPFYCDVSCIGGGISLDTVDVAGIIDPSIALVSGLGPCTARNISFYNPGTFPHIGESSNLLQFTDFSSTSFPDEWTLSGTTLPSLSTDYSYAGSSPFSMKFSGIAGQNNGASATVRCNPGQVVSTRFWYFATGFSGGGTFSGQLEFLNAAGNPIPGTGSNILLITADVVAGGLRIIPATAYKAPRGTRFARILFSFFGVSSGTPAAYLDVPEINVY